ncbi:MAG: YlbF family regulator [Phycisphaeraceae bacterium]|nr:YlbF family regulator [Phycisphaeraceae bacterium]
MTRISRDEEKDKVVSIMSQEEAITKAAKELGELLKEHPAVKRLQQVTSEMSRNSDAQRLVNEMNQHIEKLAEKEMTGRPIEVAEKRKLQELQQAVTLNIAIRNFQNAQMDYLDLMRKVDDAMGLVTRQSAPAPGSPGTPGSPASGGMGGGSGGPVMM